MTRFARIFCKITRAPLLSTLVMTLPYPIIASANSYDTDAYVSAFFDYFNLKPKPIEETFLRDIPGGSLGMEYAAMGSLVPNRHFDGKQWRVSRGAVVDTASAIKSLIRYSQVVLPPETFPNAYFSSIGIDLKKLGYSKKDQLYVAAFYMPCGSEDHPRKSNRS